MSKQGLTNEQIGEIKNYLSSKQLSGKYSPTKQAVHYYCEMQDNESLPQVSRSKLAKIAQVDECTFLTYEWRGFNIPSF